MKPLYSKSARITFRGKNAFCMSHRSSQTNFHSVENVRFPLSNSFSVYAWSSKEASHLDGPFEYPQHMFWLRK